MDMADLSRRAFLGTGTAMGLGAMLAPAAEAKPYDPMPAKWDETYDVVVIGSGFAGLAAAIEAKAAGLDGRGFLRRCRPTAATRSSMAAFSQFRESPSEGAWRQGFTAASRGRHHP